MIIVKEKPDRSEDIIQLLHPFVREWFFKKFKDFSLPQQFAVMEVHSRNNVLVSAPTGSGKTLTSFLAILNELIDSSEKEILEDRIYCVYISPLKALNNDIGKNLLEPLKEIEEIAGKSLGIRVGVRTGDTTLAERAKMLAKPPHILITTPESAALILNSIKFREHIKKVDWLIVDEIHALAENKRGVHLSISLERLQYISPGMCRVGLSACLDYNEYITLADGNIIKIGDLFVQLIKKCPIKKVSGMEYISVKGLNVFSVNKNGKLVSSEVSSIWRIPASNNLVNVTLSTGKTIKITANDKFLTLKNGKLFWRGVTGFKVGDLIAIPKKINVKRGNKFLLSYIINCEEVYTKNPNKLIKFITNKEIKKRKITLKELAESLDLPYNKLIHLRERDTNTVSLPILNKILKISNKPLPNISYLCGRTGKHFVKMPFIINNDFMRLFGLLASDGHVDHGIVSFANKNSILIKEVRHILTKLFDRSPHIRSNVNNNFLLTLKSVPISHILKALGLNFGDKVRTMTIHQDILALSSDNICAFISGFLDGDGCVSGENEESSTYFRIHSYSKDFIEKMYFCFVRLGIHPSKLYNERDDGTLYYLQITSSSDRYKLYQLLKRYKGKADKLKINIKEEQRTNFFPIGDIILNYKKSTGLFYRDLDKLFGVYVHDIVTRGYCSEYLLNKIIRNLKLYKSNHALLKLFIKIKNFDISFEKIDNIKKINCCDKYVYDLSVNKHKNFVASNIIVHNTISPLDEVAKFLVGDERPCKIVDARFNKDFDIKVISPVEDLVNTSYESISSATYDLVDKLVHEHKTTLIFTNTRSGTERVVHHLRNKFPKKYTEITEEDPTGYRSLIGAHHGSLSKTHRFAMEEALRQGKLKAIVSSTSLELGIDIGYVDLVICLGSPKSIARLLQRSGRSGHRLHDTVKCRVIILDRDDLVECAVMVKHALERKIDKIHIPTNCLDVLAQQIDGLALEQVWDLNELYSLIKKSYCYKDLSKTDFDEVVSYLAGEFASLEDRYVYAKIWKNDGKIGKRGKLGRVIYMTNIGTIPDETFVIVKVGEQVIGHVDENFLERLKPGDIFVLGGNTYEYRFAKGMVAQVKSAEGKRPTIPSWFSEMLPLSFDLALDIQKFRFLMDDKFKNKKTKKEIMDFVNDYLYVDQNAAEAIYHYFSDQCQYLEIPHNKKILVEHFIDEHNKYYILFHSLYGRRVNDVLSRALAFAIGRNQHRDVEVGINDNGFYISCPKRVNALQAFKLIKSKQVRDVLKLALDKSEVLKRRFRHCAARAFMILRTYKGQTKRVGKQQVSSMLLLNAVRRISDDFCILKEARREVLEDLMDIDNAALVLKEIENGDIKVIETSTVIPSPFAFNLILEGYSDVLKMEERHEFLQRMHANVRAKIGLKK